MIEEWVWVLWVQMVFAVLAGVIVAALLASALAGQVNAVLARILGEDDE